MALPITITLAAPYLLVSQNTAVLDVETQIAGYSFVVIEKVNAGTVGYAVNDQVFVKFPSDNLNIIVLADQSQYTIIKESDIIFKSTFVPN